MDPDFPDSVHSGMAVVRPLVVLGVAVRNGTNEYIEIGLFPERAPKTCMIFRGLCSGTRISFRITQGGLVIDSVLGTHVTTDHELPMQLKPDLPTPDRKRFDQEGLLYMSEQADAEGRANQFTITTGPRPDLNGKRLVLGTVISGHDILHYLVQMLERAHDKTELPLPLSQMLSQAYDDTELPITLSPSDLVAESGSGMDMILGAFDAEAFINSDEDLGAIDVEALFDPVVADSSSDEAHDRGRMKRRRPSSVSPSHITSRSTAPPSAKAIKKDTSHAPGSPPVSPPAERPEANRRSSEHTMDETRRGRQGFSPRAATPIQEDEEMRAARHLRRRSSPPSRGPKRDAEQDKEEEGYRRRGSLPNHRDKIYHDQAGKVYESSGSERRRSKEPVGTPGKKTYGGLRPQHAHAGSS